MPKALRSKRNSINTSPLSASPGSLPASDPSSQVRAPLVRWDKDCASRTTRLITWLKENEEARRKLFSDSTQEAKQNGRKKEVSGRSKSYYFEAAAREIFQNDEDLDVRRLSQTRPSLFSDKIDRRLRDLRKAYSTANKQLGQTGAGRTYEELQQDPTKQNIIQSIIAGFPWWPDLHGFWRTNPGYNITAATANAGQDLEGQALALFKLGNPRSGTSSAAEMEEDCSSGTDSGPTFGSGSSPSLSAGLTLDISQAQSSSYGVGPSDIPLDLSFHDPTAWPHLDTTFGFNSLDLDGMFPMDLDTPFPTDQLASVSGDPAMPSMPSAAPFTSFEQFDPSSTMPFTSAEQFVPLSTAPASAEQFIPPSTAPFTEHFVSPSGPPSPSVDLSCAPSAVSHPSVVDLSRAPSTAPHPSVIDLSVHTPSIMQPRVPRPSRARHSHTPAPLSFRGGASCLAPSSRASAKGKGKAPPLQMEEDFSDDDENLHPPPSHYRPKLAIAESSHSSSPVETLTTRPTSIEATHDSGSSSRRRKRTVATVDPITKLSAEVDTLISQGTQIVQGHHQTKQERRNAHYQDKADERKHQERMAKSDREFKLEMAKLEVEALRLRLELVKQTGPQVDHTENDV